jgi:hypothetical protein
MSINFDLMCTFGDTNGTDFEGNNDVQTSSQSKAALHAEKS